MQTRRRRQKVPPIPYSQGTRLQLSATIRKVREKKIGQVTHIAPLNRLPLLGFPPGGLNRSWSYEARPGANINGFVKKRRKCILFLNYFVSQIKEPCIYS